MVEPTRERRGALRSTVQDMLRFLAANMGLKDAPLYTAMQTTHESRVMAGPYGQKVGLGWHIRVSDKETIWHNDETGGYRSFAGFVRLNAPGVRGGDRGVVVLTNSTQSVDDIGFHLLDVSFPRVLGQGVAVSVDVSGAWIVTPDSGNKHLLRLKQDGNRVTGTSTGGTIEGEVGGDTFRFTVSTDVPIVDAVGQVDGNQITFNRFYGILARCGKRMMP